MTKPRNRRLRCIPLDQYLRDHPDAEAYRTAKRALIDWQFDKKARDCDFVRIGELDIQIADLGLQRRAIPCDKKEPPELRETWEKALAERGKLFDAGHQLRVGLRRAAIDALLKHPRRGTPPGHYAPNEIDDSIIWSMEVFDVDDRKICDAKGDMAFGSVAVLPPDFKGRCQWDWREVKKALVDYLDKNRHLGVPVKKQCLAALREDPKFKDLQPPLPMRAVEMVWKDCADETGLELQRHGPRKKMVKKPSP